MAASTIAVRAVVQAAAEYVAEHGGERSHALLRHLVEEFCDDVSQRDVDEWMHERVRKLSNERALREAGQ